MLSSAGLLTYFALPSSVQNMMGTLYAIAAPRNMGRLAGIPGFFAQSTKSLCPPGQLSDVSDISTRGTIHLKFKIN